MNQMRHQEPAINDARESVIGLRAIFGNKAKVPPHSPHLIRVPLLYRQTSSRPHVPDASGAVYGAADAHGPWPGDGGEG